jgi:signal transduction histidine kinase/ActR/RegA family two-component response regulator
VQERLDSERPRRGLHAKMVRTLLLSLLLVGVLALFTIARLQVEAARQIEGSLELGLRASLEGKGRTLTQAQARAFVPLTEVHALSDMHDLIRSTLQADRDISYGMFSNADGQLLAYADQTSVDDDPERWPPFARELARLPLPVAHVVREDARLGVIEFGAPVISGDEALGVVRYGLSKRRMVEQVAATRAESRRALERTLGFVAAILASVTLLGVVLSVRLAHRISKPILALTAAAKRFSFGEHSARVSINSGDEIQTLGEAFNTMAADLQGSIDELQKSRDALALEVEERKRTQSAHDELQQRLSQAQKLEAVGQLAGGVAHDFNNLLTAIMGSSALLRDMLEGRLSEQEAEVLTEIDEACGRACQVTNQLLAFARRGMHQPRRVSVVSALQGLQRVLRRLLPESIECSIELSTETPAVFIDPGRLEQVVLNLAVNARDAMKNGGRLVVKSRAIELTEFREPMVGALCPGTYALLTVQDTGEGIPAALLQRIFEPFFTTKEAGKGTGLGLATVHGIVEEAGGAIDLESTVGVGSCFSIWFPATEAAADAALRAPTTVTPRGQGEHILICEDDPAVNRFLTLTLERHGFRTTSFGAPKVLLAHAENMTDPPALLLTDVIMPQMNGRELVERARQRWSDLLVVFVSGYQDGILEEHAFGGTLPELLVKPFSAEDLVQRVSDVLRKRDGGSGA